MRARFKAGDLLCHKVETDAPICLVINNYDHEVPSKMPPVYERRVCLLFSHDGKFRIESPGEMEAMVSWRVMH